MRLLALALAALVLAGCGSNGTTSSPKAEWKGPTDVRADGTIGVSAFDDFLAGDGQIFAGSPVAAVTEFLNLDNSSAGTTSVIATSPAEIRDQSHVVVTLDNLLDDSVRATRYVVEAAQAPDNTWRLRAATWTRRCQPGRGHQDFSTKPCA
jgi:hypothetical protein